MSDSIPVIMGIDPTSPTFQAAHLEQPHYQDMIQSPLNTGAPPNTPSSDFSLSPQVSRHSGRSRTINSFSSPPRLASLNIHHEVDFRALAYVDSVDENLICAICRCPLIDPVTTPCDHVFCQSCMDETFNHMLMCPIDRLPLQRQATLQTRAPKIVLNQLDGLKVKCPQCDNVVARAILENHLEKYCLEAVMWCPGKHSEKHCDKQVKRKLASKGCLHFTTECPDCQTPVLQIDVDTHRETECEERLRECEHCGCDILRCKETEHLKDCPDVITSCKWAEYGCKHKAKRIDLHLHTDECSYNSVGLLAEMMKEEINALRSDVRKLTETNNRQERRIKFLERGSREYERHTDDADFSDPTSYPSILDSTSEPYPTGFDDIHAALGDHASALGQLEAGMKELEAKQTTMLFNETIPIKYELNEIKNMQQTTAMHVRWLMNFRVKENQRRAGGGPGPGPSSDNGGPSSGDSTLPLRLNDTSSRGDIITKL